MSTEAEELQRIISASVRDLLDAFRIQACIRPEAPQDALRSAEEELLEGLVRHRPRGREQRVALVPSVVRLLLAAFIEEIAASQPKLTKGDQ